MAGYRINLHKLMAFLSIINKHKEKDIVATLPFTTASMEIKYLEINLTKKVKDLCNENLNF